MARLGKTVLCHCDISTCAKFNVVLRGLSLFFGDTEAFRDGIYMNANTYTHVYVRVCRE